MLRSSKGYPFIWQTELSLAYTQDGKGRRVHHLVLAPGKEVVEQITEALLKIGRVDYDGRPIFGMSSIEFVEMLRNISDKIEVIPAHCMTPYFGVFGSKSGFNSLKDCFQEKEKYIHAVETGMSADPPMLWRFSHLEGKNLVSFSDIHSFWPWRLGREATLFDTDVDYGQILNAIRTGDKLNGTLEVPPPYGKYHYDGHRLCNVVLHPDDTKKHGGICPVCKNKLTIGVAYRVEELADKPEGHKQRNPKSFNSVIPLTELIAAAYGIKQLSSKKAWEVYNKLLNAFGSEFNILLSADKDKLAKVVDPKLADLIILNRANQIKIKPGYDGVYGELVVTDKIENKQKTLGDY